ncbi:hypothetical protein [Sphingopyxis witflariensis]|nr:hypothetical protein [Sphingopyxis witflariensis]
MRLFTVAILSVAALGTGVSATKPAPTPAPFNGAWMICEDYQGSRICDYNLLAQRGDRVCGIQSYFATNSEYRQRFVATAKANVARIDKICGDPGSETDTYCAGEAPSGAEKVGWGTSDETLLVCGGRLHGASDGDAPSCAKVNPQAGLPKVRSLGDQAPEAAERAWLASCVGGAE